MLVAYISFNIFVDIYYNPVNHFYFKPVDNTVVSKNRSIYSFIADIQQNGFWTLIFTCLKPPFSNKL
ncbi:hypothetical protein CN395_29055 [Priestia megaterium]|nr:hypothetical protein COM71_23180 [Priestia megaterium]PER66355.1 hypothetical protein CN492_26810 [Priestia megaterium]PEU51246.1 hypothetical protein CN395_29055 [Priestia megaterium]PFK46414.1 hypothetical protein COJ23_22615 [Priestia megaterium]PFP05790.1 hypothetical protein COJ90_28160 [Priestia megaterium]